jgi:hypothetical protein
VTRPRGTVPIHLARHRAAMLARWLSGFEVSKGTILSDAGIPEHEVVAREQHNRDALENLKAALTLAKAGRPRKSVSTHFLPIDGLLLLNDWRATLTLPWALRPLLWQIHRQLRAKHRSLLTPDTRRRNIANGHYSPETERKYRRMLKVPTRQTSRPKGNGLFDFKPDDRDARKEPILDILPMMILPQFFAK